MQVRQKRDIKQGKRPERAKNLDTFEFGQPNQPEWKWSPILEPFKKKNGPYQYPSPFSPSSAELPARFHALGWSPNSTQLAAACSDASVHLWHVTPGFYNFVDNQMQIQKQVNIVETQLQV